jgi:hypothetical protein
VNHDELALVLGDGSFRFRMGTRRIDGTTWLRERSGDATRRIAKTQVFAGDPARVQVWGDAKEAHVASAADLLERALGIPSRAERTPLARWADAANATGPDLLLVRTSDLRLDAIAVAFPSGWSPEDALGRTTPAIHAAVPGLEPSLGRAIDRFLHALGADDAYARSNWGLVAGDALDRHPDAALPAVRGNEPLAMLNLRVEEQAFLGLGLGGSAVSSEALLFGVHVVHYDLEALSARVDLRKRLADALESMPEDVARYKGLAEGRHEIAARLR